MTQTNIRIRVNRTTGEVEIEGTQNAVEEWWDKIWPEVSKLTQAQPGGTMSPKFVTASNEGTNGEVFGEFYSNFRSDITDVDRILIAGAYAQGRDADRVFTTKIANQLLLDQNVKVSNASECVRRLLQSKRVFVVSDGKFRASAAGLEGLKAMRISE